jgi:peroxiredoxin Q/BCP
MVKKRRSLNCSSSFLRRNQMTDALVGQTLPALSLAHSDGGEVNFPDDFKGHYSILYFYPKDDTPGCTKQACAYRDNIDTFKEEGIQLFGVSLDDLDSHDHFRKKYSLNFPLIADVNHQLSEALGVYGDQEWAGKVFKGLSRDSFLIGPDAQILEVWRRVDPLSTAAETLAAALEAKS